MEIVFGIAIFVLAAAGLGLGLMFGRPPVKGSCGGRDCAGGGACAACPRRAEGR